MKEDVNEKRLALIANVLALSDEEVLALSLGPDATTQSDGGSHPPGPPPPPPPPGDGD